MCYRIDNLEHTISSIPTEFDEKLSAFAETIGEIQDKLSEYEENLESRAKEQEIEKAFIEGVSNIMNYEVPNGRGKQTQQ